MLAEASHVFALIGLRALADYDPFEFRRATDLSKRQVDERIDHLILHLGVTEDPILKEIETKLNELRGIDVESESPLALSFLLRQLSVSALDRAFQLALSHERTSAPTERTGPLPARTVSEREPGVIPFEEEFLRLAVMRLLRELPEYSPRFGHRSRAVHIDCLLETSSPGLPPIIVEAKARLRSGFDVERAINVLGKTLAGWSRDTIGVVVVGPLSGQTRAQWRRHRSRFFLLSFDPETNEFVRGDIDALLKSVRVRREPGINRG